MPRLIVRALAAVAVATWAGTATADPADPADPEPSPESVMAVALTRDDLDQRPHLTSTDLFRYVPGLAVLAPGRGGVADQLLARGIDAGQGGALGIVVDGIPVNLGSHVGGDGYADTHFVIADTIGSVAFHPGPPAARLDPFAGAGQLALETIDRVPGGAAVRLTTGTETTTDQLGERLLRLGYRLVAMASPPLERGSAVVAAELGVLDGPYTHPQRYRRGAVFGKWKRPVGRGQLTTVVQLYTGRWFDAGLLPVGELAAGRLRRYGAVDPSQGGLARRASGSVAFDVDGWHLGGYVVGASWQRYANPTLFLVDPDRGDEREYVDRRVVVGLDGAYRRAHVLAGKRGTLRVGVQARGDDVAVETWHTARRARLAALDAAAPQVEQLAIYAEDTLAVTRQLTLLAGVRLDEVVWNLATSGSSGERGPISPRLGAGYHAGALDVVGLASVGAQATDARAAAATSGYGAYARTVNAELGARVHPDPRVSAGVAVWWGQADASAAWIPETAMAARVPELRRRGIDASLAFRPTSWLAFDAALGVARGNTLPPRGAPHGPLPLAPRLIGAGGVTFGRAPSFVAVRARAIGARDTGDPRRPTAPSTVVDLIAQHRWRGVELGLAIENVLDTRWSEVQLAGDVRPSRDATAQHDLLIMPGVPRTVMVTVGVVP